MDGLAEELFSAEKVVVALGLDVADISAERLAVVEAAALGLTPAEDVCLAEVVAVAVRDWVVVGVGV